MKDTVVLNRPHILNEIEKKSEEIGFTMPSDIYIGSLLKTLVASKPNAKVVELGTGIGLSLAWIVEGLSTTSTVITVDNDPKLSAIAKDYFGNDSRVHIICEDGSKWIQNYKGEQFDLVFADAWPGKYSEIEEILSLVKIGGFYVIDDMSAQPNWPEGHTDNVDALIAYLEKREDFVLTKLNWSTGLILAVKTS